MPESIENIQSLNTILLWTCFTIIAILWAIVAFFVKRLLDKMDDRFNTHSTRLDDLKQDIAEVNVKLASTVNTNQVGEIYDWTKQELSRLREHDIMPLREDAENTKRSFHSDMRQFETRVSGALVSLKQEIKDDMKIIIQLLQKQ